MALGQPSRSSSSAAGSLQGPPLRLGSTSPRLAFEGDLSGGPTRGGSRALAGDGGSPLARQGEWPGGDPDRLPGLAAVACPPQRSGVGNRNREAETRREEVQ